MLPTVIKRDGSRQSFIREKIRAGLVLACRKRPVSGDAIDMVISQVERHFAELLDREVPSTAIGEQLLRELRGVDEVAYVRFASVYREFSDVNQFVMELDRLHGDDETDPV
jgi:transcriptional repressor NrdR